MVDDADRAAAMMQDAEARALANRLVRMHARGCGTSCCTVCGDPIPFARQQAIKNCRTCVECQEGLDAEAARRGA